jgi:beta-lactamase class A
MNLKRRHFVITALLAGVGARHSFARLSDSETKRRFTERLREIEAGVGGRLGVHILDTSDGETVGYREDERFMLLSTFKLLAGALVLHRVDAGLESLDRRVFYGKEDLVAWSPVTEKHVGGKGMTVGELCAAMITVSDNTAANLILASYGGPAALTAYLRQLGDAVTRLDRIEPELNRKHPAGEMDTTSPRAMVQSMRRVLVGEALSGASRERLRRWLLDNTTGGKRLKAGLPQGWRIGDKTGTNEIDANDVAIIWPPSGDPILVSAYLADSRANSAAKDASIAKVGELVAELAG